MPVDRMGTGFREKGELQLGATWGGTPRKKKSFSLVCILKTCACSQVVVTLPSTPGSHPQSSPISDNPGATFSHSPPTPPGCHSPSIAAVPTEQGVIGALQEIEVPFGSQRSQRKHVTAWTLWAQYPSHTCGHICVDHRHQHVDALGAPLPSPLF